MTLVYKGHTFDEMVEAINENEILKNKLEDVENELALYKSLNRTQKNFISKKDYKIKKLLERIEILEQDYELLEKSHDDLLEKYNLVLDRVDGVMNCALDTLLDCDNMR